MRSDEIRQRAKECATCEAAVATYKSKNIMCPSVETFCLSRHSDVPARRLADPIPIEMRPSASCRVVLASTSVYKLGVPANI